MSAQSFNKAQINRGTLTMEHVAELVRLWQETYALTVDGFAGEQTIKSINQRLEDLRDEKPLPPLPVDPLTIERIFPLAPLRTERGALPDVVRQAQITSGHSSENPDRPNHHGADLFYRYDPKLDPTVKVGDGGAAGGKDGKPKWWIPPGTMARAAAAGIITHASNTPTGIRVWIDHGGGVRTGYFHLRSCINEITPGANVAMGQLLGEVGDNPSDRDAAHLHFELYVGDLASYPAGSINPRAWLESSPHD